MRVYDYKLSLFAHLGKKSREVLTTFLVFRRDQTQQARDASESDPVRVPRDAQPAECGRKWIEAGECYLCRLE